MWKHKPNKGFPPELLWTWRLSQQFLNLASVLEWDCLYHREMVCGMQLPELLRQVQPAGGGGGGWGDVLQGG